MESEKDISSTSKKPKYRWTGKPANGHPNWKKGESGNPAGRSPTAKCIPDILRRIGDEPCAPENLRFLRRAYPNRNLADDLPSRDAMLLRCYFEAEQNDDSARSFIAERTEGKIKESIALTHEDKPTLDDETKTRLADYLRAEKERARSKDASSAQ